MEGENAVSETPNGTPNGMVTSFGKYYRLFAYLFFCFLSAFIFVCFVSWLIRLPTWLFVRVDFLFTCSVNFSVCFLVCLFVWPPVSSFIYWFIGWFLFYYYQASLKKNYVSRKPPGRKKQRRVIFLDRVLRKAENIFLFPYACLTHE